MSDTKRYRRIIKTLFIPGLLGLGILATFSREVLIAYYYGASREVEIYKIAFALPYALFQSLGTVLVGGLLPILFNNGLHNIYIIRRQILVVFAGIFVAAIATVRWQAALLAPGFSLENLDVLRVNMYLCWSILLFSALIVPVRLILQYHEHKILVSATSLIFSITFLALLPLAQSFLSANILSILSIVSIALVASIYLVSARTVPVVQLASYNAQPEQGSRTAEWKITRIIFGAFIYVVLLAAPRMIDRAFASNMGSGVVANVDYAMNIYTALGILIGTSFSIIYAKKIASESSHTSGLLRWIWQVLRIPVGVGLLVLLLVLPFTGEIVQAVYVRGEFLQSDGVQVDQILFWLLVSLPLMIIGMLLSQMLAALSIEILIAVSLIKIFVKFISIEVLQGYELMMFGSSTLCMEMAGVFVSLLLFASFKQRKR